MAWRAMRELWANERGSKDGGRHPAATFREADEENPAGFIGFARAACRNVLRSLQVCSNADGLEGSVHETWLGLARGGNQLHPADDSNKFHFSVLDGIEAVGRNHVSGSRAAKRPSLLGTIKRHKNQGAGAER